MERLNSLQESCDNPENAAKAWLYKDSFLTNDEEVLRRINAKIAQVKRDYENIVEKLKNALFLVRV